MGIELKRATYSVRSGPASKVKRSTSRRALANGGDDLRFIQLANFGHLDAAIDLPNTLARDGMGNHVAQFVGNHGDAVGARFVLVEEL
jgi:hypothetical protein